MGEGLAGGTQSGGGASVSVAVRAVHNGAGDERRVAIVGGGLAGIAAALDCARGGAKVTLLESRPRLGGAAYSFSATASRSTTGSTCSCAAARRTVTCWAAWARSTQSRSSPGSRSRCSRPDARRRGCDGPACPPRCTSRGRSSAFRSSGLASAPPPPGRCRPCAASTPTIRRPTRAVRRLAARARPERRRDRPVVGADRAPDAQPRARRRLAGAGRAGVPDRAC